MISIPTTIEDKVVSVLLTSVVNDEVTYFHVPLSLIQQSSEAIVEVLGIEKAMLAVSVFTAHEQHFGEYMSLESVGHLHSELMAGAITSAVPRGWCLIEIVLYTPSNDDTHTSQTTNWVTQNGTYYEPKQGSSLHGQNINGEYMLYRFWSWCLDGQDQSGWDFNLGEPMGGISTIPILPDWTYYGSEWFEDNDDCMFYFGGMAEAEFTAFENSLLDAACGDAAAYVIQNTMASVINGLCSQTDGNFPPQLFDIGETIDEIEDRLADNMIFSMGQLICETCEGNAACLDQFAVCSTENHESCVRVKALLISNPDIQLTSLEILFLEQHLDRLAEIEFFLTSRTDLESEVRIRAVELFVELLTSDPDFESLSFGPADLVDLLSGIIGTYGLNFSESELMEIIGAGCIEVSNGQATVDEGCAAGAIFDHMSEGFNFSEEEKALLRVNQSLDVENKVKVIKIEWSSASEKERVDHVFRWLSWIHFNHSCKFTSTPSNLNTTYNISQDFFTNATTGATGSQVYNVTLDFIDPNGVPQTVENVGFVWTVLMGSNFYWHDFIQGSASNKTHFLFYRENSQPQFGNAVIDFIIPNIDVDIVDGKLNRPCK